MKKTRSRLYIFLILFNMMLFIGCAKKEAIDIFDCTNTTVLFNAQIKPILDINCTYAPCHDAKSKSAGIDLTTYVSAKETAKKPEFLGCIQQKKGYKPMPQGANRLSNNDVKTLSCWVQSGLN